MNIRTLIMLIVAAAFRVYAASAPDISNISNPILPEFHADPEIIYSNLTHRYYIYSTTDGFPGWGGQYYTCYSSDNLTDWKYEGVPLDVSGKQVSWADGNLWAPAIEEKYIDGAYKYFLYFSAALNGKDNKCIGVAVADHPAGPFVALPEPMITESPVGYGQQIDVDVFTDPETGQSYLYWGNGYLAVAELSGDMMSVNETTIKVITPEGGTLDDYNYREGAYVFYRDGVYYFLWSVDDTGSPNYHVAYGTSSSPAGPIKVAESPVILAQDPDKEIYGTAHNSVIRIPGTDDWLIVYHRINKSYLDNAPGIHREVCADPLRFTGSRILPVHPH